MSPMIAGSNIPEGGELPTEPSEPTLSVLQGSTVDRLPKAYQAFTND